MSHIRQNKKRQDVCVLEGTSKKPYLATDSKHSPAGHITLVAFIAQDGTAICPPAIITNVSASTILKDHVISETISCYYSDAPPRFYKTRSGSVCLHA